MKENIIKNKSTPVMRQYWKAKKQYPDAIMLFRMGDFYETFDKDAKITADILNIALTKRSNGAASSVPLAGFPYHSLDQYIHKLLISGYKVALCEQVEDPKFSKGIVKREVVEVLSPGTAIASKFLIENENNFLASLYSYNKIVGYSIIDNSTGEFFCGETNHKEIKNIIVKYKIKEVITPESQESIFSNILDNSIMITTFEDWKSDYDNCYELLLKQFKTNSLKGYGIDNNPILIKTSGSCIYYIENNYFGKTNHITSLSRKNSNGYMHLDDFTIKNLEIFNSLNDGGQNGTLINVIDKTTTSMGSRLLKKHLREPLVDIKKINFRLNLTEELINNQNLLSDIIEYLKKTTDIERIIGRISNNKANPPDLINLSHTLSCLDRIEELLNKENKTIHKLLKNKKNVIKLIKLIDDSIVQNPPVNINKGYFIKDKINKSLDDYREISKDANKWLLNYQEEQKENTGISSLKISYNKVFGYFIDITKTHLDKVPENFIRKQTLTNSERYFTVELKKYEDKILFSNEKCLEIENEIFSELQNKIVSNFSKIQNNAKILSNLDVICSNATLAINYNYCKPLLNDKYGMKLVESRHPVVERLLPINNEFISNDLLFKDQNRHLGIITGPNMSGKSTYLRQVALVVLLAQMGSYVPASECTLGIVDQLFTRVGASDNLAGGESTFLVEMNEAANILNNATRSSLIILDEIGRGTSTFDGLSIAWSITEYLHNNPSIKARTLFATHYHELIFLAEELKGAFNLNIDVKEFNDEIIFLRKIKEGGASKSYGIQVAEMAGLPSQVVSRAKKLLFDFMNNKKDNFIDGKNDKQLDLFKKENDLLDRIKKIDVDNLSPVEALNFLYDFKKDLK